MKRSARIAAIGLVTIACAFAPPAGSAAAAVNPDNPVCGAAGVLSGPAATGCGGIASGGRLLQAGKQLVTGNVGGAVNTAVGGAAQAVASTASTALGLAAIGTWVLGGAVVLKEAATVLGQTTAPQLHTTWFSSTYWRMAAIGAVLTLPFLFAAAVQALIRSDLALLVRAALGYLPLAMLAVAIAAPVTTLLLAACDQLCTLISSAAGDESAHFLANAAGVVAGLTALTQSPFLAFLVGLFMIAAAFALWVELLMREAAVYVIVLMLPLAFAAMVWPARRIWAIRAVELLVALILSKFAIVAVLSLGGAAISASAGHLSIAGIMAGAVLVTLATFSPWAMLRLVPLAELASGAAGTLRAEFRPAHAAVDASGVRAEDWSAIATAAMRRAAEDGSPAPSAALTTGSTGDPDPPQQDSGGDGGTSGGGGPAGDGAGGPAGGGAGGPAGDEAGGRAGDGAGGPAGDEPPPQPILDWGSMRELELGPGGVGTTPVWPHEDAS